MQTSARINHLIQCEVSKRQYYRPIYSIHKWWARRPGSLFRSILLGVLEPDSPVFEATKPDWQSSRYFTSHDFSAADCIVLDPFMGGGTTLIEANRLGVRTIGCDLNPVAWWITRDALKKIDVEKLRFYYQRLEEEVAPKIQALYKTNCVNCQNHADSLYIFWVRYVACPDCGKEIYLFPHTLINSPKPLQRAAGRVAKVFCPRCCELTDWTNNEKTQCQKCGQIFDPRMGTYRRGNVRCLSCQREFSSLPALLGGKKPQERMVAIEYYCPICRIKQYKTPDNNDRQLVQKASAEFERRQDLILPEETIPLGSTSARLIKHNYRTYRDLFSERQLLCFNYIVDEIRKIEEKTYREAFITVFSNMLEYNNMMTPYNYSARKLHHLFNHHALPLTTIPVENVVWGSSGHGAGTFANCYQRYLQAKEYCERPFERYKTERGEVKTLPIAEKISTCFVNSFEELAKTPRSTFLLCGDSSNLSLVPDQSVDFVITDPPYYDNIHYSELSNFFYVWLQKISDHPYFDRSHVPFEREAVVNRGQGKSEKDYKDLLVAVFSEMQRVLKDSGKMVFTFHHKSPRAWELLLKAVSQSGFYITDATPVKSEYKVNPHIRGKRAIDTDLVIVCQKKTALSPDNPVDIEKVLRDLISLTSPNTSGAKSHHYNSH